MLYRCGGRCTTLLLAVLLLASAFVGPAAARGFTQLDLVSDQSGEALFTDSNLINPWGIAFNLGGTVLWVANNGTGLATTCAPDGTPLSLVVTIPPPVGEIGPARPTGIVRNDTAGFLISKDTVPSAPSRFLFATEDGTISGWNPEVDETNAILAVDRSAAGSVYKGIALANTQFGGVLYATDFRNGFVDMFDSSFALVQSFTDPGIPSGFAPFGIRTIYGMPVVTYAKQLGPDNVDDEPGPGNGYVVVFTPDGTVFSEFASGGTLNSPWGLTIAPAGMGAFTRALLVGNSGDGRINAFDLNTAEFLGQVQNRAGRPLEIDGLWGLTVRRSAGPTGNDQGPPWFYFSAGPEEESEGLLGTLRIAVANGRFRTPPGQGRQR